MPSKRERPLTQRRSELIMVIESKVYAEGAPNAVVEQGQCRWS